MRTTGLKTIAAAAACKASRKILRLTGRGGTALPGKIAMLADRDILRTVSRGMHVVLVTGTNGKTTTCRMLENAVLSEGKQCLLNRSGANLLSGITAEFVCNFDLRGRPRASFAVIECDEGALKQVTQRIRPDVIVVTNLFRDQLDRYGEVLHTREEIRKGISLTPESVVCLNADCPLTATIAGGLTNPVLYYGSGIPMGDQSERELSDAKYCIHCGAELTHRYYTYSHLGYWECPLCGSKRPAADAEVTGNDPGREIRIRLRGTEQRVRIGLPGTYNIYNALAALCAGTALGLRKESILGAVSHTEAPFGRMEQFTLGNTPLRLILVKNPAGCDQAMDYITGTGEDYGIVLCLNDRTADGHDISWIWDADIEKVVRDPHRKRIWVSGTRAEDMQLRLKYAGAGEDSIVMEKDYSRLIEDLEGSGQQIFVLPNYTSMLDFREALLRKTGGEAFWEG